MEVCKLGKSEWATRSSDEVVDPRKKTDGTIEKVRGAEKTSTNVNWKVNEWFNTKFKDIKFWKTFYSLMLYTKSNDKIPPNSNELELYKVIIEIKAVTSY